MDDLANASFSHPSNRSSKPGPLFLAGVNGACLARLIIRIFRQSVHPYFDSYRYRLVRTASFFSSRCDRALRWSEKELDRRFHSSCFALWRSFLSSLLTGTNDRCSFCCSPILPSYYSSSALQSASTIFFGSYYRLSFILHHHERT